jgi:hypothetical protein
MPFVFLGSFAKPEMWDSEISVSYPAEDDDLSLVTAILTYVGYMDQLQQCILNPCLRGLVREVVVDFPSSGDRDPPPGQSFAIGDPRPSFSSESLVDRSVKWTERFLQAANTFSFPPGSVSCCATQFIGSSSATLWGLVLDCDRAKLLVRLADEVLAKRTATPTLLDWESQTETVVASQSSLFIRGPDVTNADGSDLRATSEVVDSNATMVFDLVVPIGSDCSAAEAARVCQVPVVSPLPSGGMERIGTGSFRHQSGPFDWIRSQPASILKALQHEKSRCIEKIKIENPQTVESIREYREPFCSENLAMLRHIPGTNSYTTISAENGGGPQEEQFPCDKMLGLIATSAVTVTDIRRRLQRLVAQLNRSDDRLAAESNSTSRSRPLRVCLVYVHHVDPYQQDLTIDRQLVDETPFESLMKLNQFFQSELQSDSIGELVIFAFNFCPYHFTHLNLIHHYVGFPEPGKPWFSVGRRVAELMEKFFPIALSDTFSVANDDDPDEAVSTNAFL